MRVLDFSQYLSEPTVTRLMAEMGAEIVKVERGPKGDPSRGLPAIKDGRSGCFVQQNLGKQSLSLDMDAAATDDIVRTWVRHVDIAVENFGLGVMDKRADGILHR
jgi:crotonobetainyl-CoA:carnitine CoA-transferase CaiB-like acyl-CoA transferase